MVYLFALSEKKIALEVHWTLFSTILVYIQQTWKCPIKIRSRLTKLYNTEWSVYNFQILPSNFPSNLPVHLYQTQSWQL